MRREPEEGRELCLDLTIKKNANSCVKWEIDETPVASITSYIKRGRRFPLLAEVTISETKTVVGFW